MDKELTAIDLFCGCGGISCGLRNAGFRVIAGVDVEPKYLATFRHNFPEALSLDADLSDMPPEDFMALVSIQPGELDLLVGGPPCQGFSKNVPRKYRFLEDSRNLLIKTFLDYCEALKPRAILMENVAEMKNGFDQTYTQEVMERLTDAGYAVSHAVLNAADYGVPQMRRRAFFLAVLGEHVPSFPEPSHSKAATQMELLGLDPYVTVWDAIGDLPPLEHGEGRELTEYACPPFSSYQHLVRNGQREVTNHVSRRLQPTQFARLAALQPGQGHKDLPEHLQVKSGYSGAYGRLTKDMVAPTITRWVFHPGSGRWGHPIDIRTLSIREVARIQSFPDDFQFVGSYCEEAGQLGNAVPPMLAEKLAQSLRTYLAATH